jgi:hypothetical protein
MWYGNGPLRGHVHPLFRGGASGWRWMGCKREEVDTRGRERGRKGWLDDYERVCYYDYYHFYLFQLFISIFILENIFDF